MSTTETSEVPPAAAPDLQAGDRGWVEVELIALTEDAMAINLAVVKLLDRVGGSQLACFDMRKVKWEAGAPKIAP